MDSIKFEDYEKLVYKIINHFLYMSPLPKTDFLEDLFSQSQLIFSKCIIDWNPSKTKFSTFFTSCLRRELRWYIVDEYKITYIPIKENDLLNTIYKKEGKWIKKENGYNPNISPLNDVFFKMKLNNLSKEAKEIVNNVLEPSPQILYLISTRYKKRKNYKITKNLLQKYFHGSLKWSYKNIELAFKEIEYMLK